MKSLKMEKLECFPSPAYPIISDAEAKIIGILIKNNIPYLREVSYKGFITENGGHYRFDFLLLRNGVLIEYDGKQWHNSKDQKKRDRIKTKFCKDNNLKLVRINRMSWHKLESVILQATLL